MISRRVWLVTLPFGINEAVLRHLICELPGAMTSGQPSCANDVPAILGAVLGRVGFKATPLEVVCGEASVVVVSVVLFGTNGVVNLGTVVLGIEVTVDPSVFLGMDGVVGGSLGALQASSFPCSRLDWATPFEAPGAWGTKVALLTSRRVGAVMSTWSPC